MKTSCFVVLAALAAATTPGCTCRRSPPPQQTPADTLTEQSFKLSNGLRVDIASGACGDVAAIAVLVRIGIDNDPVGRSGLARMVGYLVSTQGGAGKASKAVVTGNDFTLYAVTANGDGILGEIDGVGGWMSKYTPGDEDLGRARAHVLDRIAKLQGADAEATARSLAEEAVQPTRGNGRRDGVAAEVEAVTLEELQAFWKEHVKPGNAQIAVAGRVDAGKVRARIEAALGPLPAGTPPATRSPADATVKGTLVMGDAPTAVAIAVPAPPLADPLYPAFLVLAARLMDKSTPGRSWQAEYDPIARSEMLFIVGAVSAGEPPEAAASRIRAEASAMLARPQAPKDQAMAGERFGLFLGLDKLDPAACAKDPGAFALARVRRTHLELDSTPIGQTLGETTPAQLEDAAKLFEPKRTAAVIAGGAIR